MRICAFGLCVANINKHLFFLLVNFMIDNIFTFLNERNFKVIQRYIKQWGSKKTEYLIIEDEFGYKYNRETLKIIESIKDETIYNYRFKGKESEYNKRIYINIETCGDVECIDFFGKNIKMYSKKFDRTWSKTWANILKSGIYEVRFLDKNGFETGYSLNRKNFVNKLSKLIGLKFGRLSVIDVTFDTSGKRKRHKLVCQCDCGNIKNVEKSDLLNGRVRSCGCLHSEILSEKMSSVSPWQYHNSYKWYFYDKNKNIIPCRSSYEVLYANYLIDNNINFEYEPKCFKISNKRRYTPDFYLIDLDLWIEIKGRSDSMTRSNQIQSRDIFSKNHNFKIYFWEDLMKICDLKYKSSSSYSKNAKKNNVSYEYYLANRMYQ